MRIRLRQKIMLVLLFVLTLLVLIGSPLIGTENISFAEILKYVRGESSTDGLIFFRLRLPRVLLAALVGASLSIAGIIFQALLRNPLATPYTLGVSSGGALGAVLMIKLGFAFTFLGFSTIQTAAFIGSLATITIVYLLTKTAGRISIFKMILAGVTVSYFLSAMILMIHFIADFTQTHQMIRWMMGGLDVVDYDIILRIAPVILLLFVVLLFFSKVLNILGVSEETALSKGVSVGKMQIILFIIGSVITGLVVSVSGPIGFIGLIVPHILRQLLGVNHRVLLPAAIFSGAAFLMICDTIARTILAPIEIPVGIITAMLGGPFFLWILVGKNGKSLA